jgi:hypothetical protein
LRCGGVALGRQLTGTGLAFDNCRRNEHAVWVRRAQKGESPLWRRDALNLECDVIEKWDAFDDETIGLPTASATSSFRSTQSLQGTAATDHTESTTLLAAQAAFLAAKAPRQMVTEKVCKMQDAESGGTRARDTFTARLMDSPRGFSEIAVCSLEQMRFPVPGPDIPSSRIVKPLHTMPRMGSKNV